MSDHSSFTDIVQASETLAARWSELAQKAIADARAQGVALEPEDVLNLREVRNAALGAELDEEAYQRELLALPALSDVARKKAIAEGDVNARAAAVADVNRGKFDVTADRWTDNAARRLSQARELGIATPAPEESTMSANERLEAIKDVKDPATKIALARKWGLL